MFCLITDFCDHVSYPAALLAAACAWRWTGSETSLKEAKSAITGAGPSAGPIFRSAAPELITQEHAAWIGGTELIRALARAAARRAARPQGPPRRAESPAPSDLIPPRVALPRPASGPAPPPRARPPARLMGIWQATADPPRGFEAPFAGKCSEVL